MFGLYEQDAAESAALRDEEYSQSDFLAHSSLFPCQLMEEDYEGDETNDTQKRHSYPSSCLSLTHVRITAEKTEQETP